MQSFHKTWRPLCCFSSNMAVDEVGGAVIWGKDTRKAQKPSSEESSPGGFGRSSIQALWLMLSFF